jgi:flagellin-specific chaperone FliS
MRSEADVERELDDQTFALQRDVVIWRLARMYGLSDEEKRKRCLESLSKLRDLLTELEVFLTDEQEGEHHLPCENGADCVQ